MKNKIKISVVALSVMACTLFSIESQSQELPVMTKTEHERIDSLEKVKEREQIQSQRADDVDKLNEMKNERSETKAKAKEAQRVEEEANDAARESKNALKSEKKAQKNRKQADKQATKAEEAREKSDQN